MITEIWKILGICIIGAVLSTVLKQKSGEYAFVIAFSTGICAMLFVVNIVAKPINEISDRLSQYGIETEYFKIALKAVGLAYITDFIADACRDAGQTSIAAKTELAGKAAIFVLSVPLMITVLEIAVGFIK